MTIAKSEKSQLEALKQALGDPHWDFRTVDGLAEDLAIPSEAVTEALGGHPEIVRKSILTDDEGRALYTAPDRPLKLRERFERFRSVL